MLFFGRSKWRKNSKGRWVKKRKARKSRSPQTGEAIKIKASKTVGFKPAPTLKGML